MASAVATTQAQEWWFIQDPNGTIGLVQGPPPTNALSAIYVATAANYQALENNDAGAVGAAQAKLAALPGDTTKQISARVQQLDAGAGAAGATSSSGVYEGLKSLLIDTAGNATSNVSTALTGDAAPVTSTPNVLTGLDAVSAIWEWHTTPSKWVRILEYVGGAVAIYLAIKGLAGIDTGVTDVAKKAVAA